MTAKPRKAAANKVDITVKNQENPVISEEERESTNPEEAPAEVPSMAPANDVDDTVHNQMNPGLNMVDRQPDPVIAEDSAGIKYDVSKPYPELVSDDPDAAARKARIRQQEAVLNAKDIKGADDDKEKREHINIVFVQSGFSIQGRVWKEGQVLTMEDDEANRLANRDTNEDVWYDLSAEEQKERYGKVFFERE